MKKIISLTFLATLFLGVYFNKNLIIDYIIENFLLKQTYVTYKDNLYTKNNSYIKYKKTNDFSPSNKEDILNIFYTALNGGWDNVTFYCSREYSNCINDVMYLLEDKEEFNLINNLVHPYNSYERIVLNYSSLGRVEFTIERLYSKNDILILNQRVETIINENIKSSMDTKTKIKTIHDYIINTTKYDKPSADKILNNMPVDEDIYKANGPLFNGLAICGGYSDAMALFLHVFEVENYKITSPKHVWNYVYYNNEWLHLDLTWDDPVTEPPKDLLLHSFFLITDEELKRLDSENHNYAN